MTARQPAASAIAQAAYDAFYATQAAWALPWDRLREADRAPWYAVVEAVQAATPVPALIPHAEVACFDWTRLRPDLWDCWLTFTDGDAYPGPLVMQTDGAWAIYVPRYGGAHMDHIGARGRPGAAKAQAEMYVREVGIWG